MNRWLRAAGSQTSREKAALLQGTNLLFGALLGVNLVTAQALPLADYANLVIARAGTVATLTVFSTTEQRSYGWALLLSYVGLVALLLFGPSAILGALSEEDRNRLAVTLAIWAGAVVLAELWPTREVSSAD